MTPLTATDIEKWNREHPVGSKVFLVTETTVVEPLEGRGADCSMAGVHFPLRMGPFVNVSNVLISDPRETIARLEKENLILRELVDTQHDARFTRSQVAEAMKKMCDWTIEARNMNATRIGEVITRILSEVKGEK